jgi:hypothetical protein
MHDLALGDLRRHAVQNRPLEDATEPLGAPALADARQRGMIGQPVLQAVAGEPADRQIDLRLAQQPPVMHDPEQEAREHQPDRASGSIPGHLGRSQDRSSTRSTRARM